MSIVFLRRRKLGHSSTQGMKSFMISSEGQSLWVNTAATFGVRVLRTDRLSHQRERDWVSTSSGMLIRWGTTAATSAPLSSQFNKSQAIHRVNDKRGFRKLLMENQPELVPHTLFSLSEDYTDHHPLVVRPQTHAQGRNLWLVHDREQLENLLNSTPQLSGQWYASKLIDKIAEYRVYVMQGRVITVANKTPDDPSAVAWNVAQGGRFDVVRWGDWNLEVCRVAIDAFNYSGLDFGGVDVMVDREGKAYVIEINSAPSLPYLSDGSISYRQKCMAKGFLYAYHNGFDHFDPVETYSNWRNVIHPAIWSPV